MRRTSPTAVVDLTDATTITAGDYHTCARRASGTVVCWGLNSYGQLGTGTAGGASFTPTGIAGLTDAVELAAGALHTCARRATGAVVCWGRNNYGQLGDGTTTNRTTPVTVAGLSDAVEIAAGYSATCARRASGAVVCWGINDSGQIGDGTNTARSIPVMVPGFP
jgi:alpha-tubulin suppressor-like RCC1 family protein